MGIVVEKGFSKNTDQSIVTNNSRRRRCLRHYFSIKLTHFYTAFGQVTFSCSTTTNSQ